MTELYLWVALFLLANIAVGMVRILRGPTAADRMLAAELFGTAAVAIMLLLASASGQTALIDVALVFALLSALAVATFVSRVWAGMAAAPASTARTKESPDDERNTPP